MNRGIVIGILALSSVAHAQISKQAECRRIVASDMEATRTKSPKVYATIETYMFEWSKSHDVCVIVVQYKTRYKAGKPAIQVLARNAVTGETMEGYDNVFLIPAEDSQRIMDATSFLFKRYSP